MTKKQFTPNPYRLSIDIDDTCGIEFNRENKNYGGFREQDYNKLKVFCKELNRLFKENEQLKKENKGLQFKIIDMLDFIKEEETVTREGIKKWWNGGI